MRFKITIERKCYEQPANTQFAEACKRHAIDLGMTAIVVDEHDGKQSGVDLFDVVIFTKRNIDKRMRL